MTFRLLDLFGREHPGADLLSLPPRTVGTITEGKDSGVFPPKPSPAEQVYCRQGEEPVGKLKGESLEVGNFKSIFIQNLKNEIHAGKNAAY